MNAKNKLTDRVKNISDTPVHHEILQEDHKVVIPLFDCNDIIWDKSGENVNSSHASSVFAKEIQDFPKLGMIITNKTL